MQNNLAKITLSASLITLLSACAGTKEDGSPGTPVATTVTADPRQVNMTVLLDLSNRISATYGADTQQNRDVAVVQSTATWFKESLAKKGAFNAKGIYNIYFEPQPELDGSLNQVASSLSFDMSKPGMDTKAKKAMYDGMVPQTTAGIKRLYEYVAKQPQMGADIWSFAKDKMASRCIQDPAKYRNVLVLVTDGYIDHVSTRNIKKGNKVAFINDTYIADALVRKNGFTASNWSSKYEAGGYGLLPPNDTSLKGLEVLVLEINTYKRPPFYADLLKRYVKDWFLAMGASRIEVRSTDLPKYTEVEVGKFLNQ